MSFYNFIAQRFTQAPKGSFSSIVTRIAIASIAVGVAIILISYGILVGFEKAIQKKIFSFGGHLQVINFNSNSSFEEFPISKESDLYQQTSQLTEVEHIHVFSLKPAILKKEEDILGVVMKGIGSDYDQNRFQQNMIEGEFLDLNEENTALNEILISRKIADKLRLEVNDSIILFFIQNNPKIYKIKVRGIYRTGMEDFDEKFIIGNIKLIQKLNKWTENQAGGYEVFLKDFNHLENGYMQVYNRMDYNMKVLSVTQRYGQLFDWLILLNTNVFVILVLILAVASFNMISILLIMIMERVQTIGILKAMGANNWQIRRIFMQEGIYLILRGMGLGNVIGLGFCAIQYFFPFVPLNAENYYMDTVPIEWDFQMIGILNLLTFFLISIVLILPTSIVATLSPIKAIRFD